MKFLYWMTGFIYNAASMLFELIPMSVTAGNICSARDCPIWEIDEEDFLEALGEEHE